MRYYQVSARLKDSTTLATTLSRVLLEELEENETNVLVVTALDGAIPIAVESTGLLVAKISEASISKVLTSTETVPSRVNNIPKICNKIEIRVCVSILH